MFRSITSWGACFALFVSGLAQAAEPPTHKTPISEVQLNRDHLRVHFIDVSGGLAMLVQTPDDGVRIFIDGGISGLDDMVRYVRHFVPTSKPINIAIVTHPDSDHYYGMFKIFKTYDVEQFWNTGYTSPPIEKSNSKWQAMLSAVRSEEDCKIYMPISDWVSPGDLEIIDDCGTTTAKDDICVRYLNVDAQPPKIDPKTNRRYREAEQRNNASLVFRLIYGDVSFLITGDINGRPLKLQNPVPDEFVESEEADMLDMMKLLPEKCSLKSTVLQVAHHGSEGASALPFLEAVDPEWAVIPAGEAHEHPHEGSIKRLKKAGVKPDHILRTDEGDQSGRGDEPPADDSFIFETDGRTITKVWWVEMEE
ncbi:MAG: MBL fold metallo-hydrolase [Planctomycetia bacterium]|nr:MBL fold metallo-hydrolase [Planctomycetia bacterium]MCC7314886.1 MBL fold metallo-hydrolase [Planctomycetota bacterium]